MNELFNRGELSDYLSSRINSGVNNIDSMSEDEILSRSTDDIVLEYVEATRLEPVVIGDTAIDGGVAETQVDAYDYFDEEMYKVRGLRISATFEYSGNVDLLSYRPSTRLMTRFRARLDGNTITVETEQSGSTPDPESTKRAIDREIQNIRTMTSHAAEDVSRFNSTLDSQFRPAVERRKKFLQDRRDLAGALGFPLKKRSDAPSPVPLERKVVGIERSQSTTPRTPYRDEPALTEAQYEDAISVISSALLSMERTPSVVTGKDEEELRDYILVMLNGTFRGNATGETFVKSGKTDVLVRVEDRHVFVGECKWWKGAKALGGAIDQLLGYLPWRDEKAALIVFIDNKDATAVFDKIEEAVKEHASFKRAGKGTSDGTKRHNFILGHPEDPEREIQLAVMFAVLPKA